LRLPSLPPLLLSVLGRALPRPCVQVVEETHHFYTSLKSGKRANDGELSLI
jgi:hypothetical protein